MGELAADAAYVVALSLLGMMLACGNTEESKVAPDSGSQSNQKNPLPTNTTCSLPLPVDTPPTATCPSECVAVIARQLASAATCARPVLLGCITCEAGCGGAPEGPCFRNVNDGRLVRAPTYAVQGRQEWVSCTTAEESQIATAPACGN